MRCIAKIVAAMAVTLGSLAVAPGAAQADPTFSALLSCSAWIPHTGDTLVYYDEVAVSPWLAWDDVFNCTALHSVGGPYHRYYVTVWDNGAVTWTPGHHYCQTSLGDPYFCPG